MCWHPLLLRRCLPVRPPILEVGCLCTVLLEPRPLSRSCCGQAPTPVEVTAAVCGEHVCIVAYGDRDVFVQGSGEHGVVSSLLVGLGQASASGREGRNRCARSSPEVNKCSCS